MKKVLFSMAALAFLSANLSALEIDANSVVTHFKGFKLKTKVAVPGVIDNAKYTFKTTNGSVAQILEGASATMDFADENTKDKVREKNIHRTFIAALSDSKITATLKDVKGDDISGNATAVITFNGVSKEVAMTYKVEDSKLVVSGVINMKNDFNLAAAYTALSTDKVISALHGKVTHEEVEISFDVDVK
ncbi:YceI family protein [Campylobacter canadensis]|uniref:YceI family protein n=1 Tax=Campylobacter canadensis TaxID=449520 RepID=A0ABS7WPC4_9BACT|nr:YceI family protein [Campylobacter canadensis]MBZ7986628.1 YceI family protein [Campylobacter canadensis]MBZ7993967.1 YceI family protein [Campylobacter canadensis]MBZ7996283.1 YceI family protein [Campylobacter canadensis]MBZ7997664.1 YceI family protein [Campylobacter canadensis]MBZ7999299.1 YceI family protein [Campylobacter canadensis]